MTSIDWTKLIDWITEGFIGVIFGAISMYIAYIANKKWEQKREAKRKELEAKNKWLMPNGIPPANVSEALKQAKKEGHNVLVWQKSLTIALLFVIGTTGMVIFAATTTYVSHNASRTQVAFMPSSTPYYAHPVTVFPDYAKTLCPIPVKQSTVDSWKIGVADIPTVKALIDEFDKERINNSGTFEKGATIPKGVIMVISFDESDSNKWSQYPVIAIAHSGSWGLFQTIGEFSAPNAGACRVVVP